MAALHTLHFAWRHAFGLMEQHPNRITMRLYNTLDAWHYRFAYAPRVWRCRCTRVHLG